MDKKLLFKSLGFAILLYFIFVILLSLTTTVGGQYDSPSILSSDPLRDKVFGLMIGIEIGTYGCFGFFAERCFLFPWAPLIIGLVITWPISFIVLKRRNGTVFLKSLLLAILTYSILAFLLALILPSIIPIALEWKINVLTWLSFFMGNGCISIPGHSYCMHIFPSYILLIIGLAIWFGLFRIFKRRSNAVEVPR